MQAVEGHLRGAIGALSIEDIYRERQRLVAAVRTLAGPDLESMGLQIVSLTIRNVADKQGYLEALGRPRTAQVKRDAIRGEGEADALRLKGLAEAEAMAAKARSWGDYNEAAITDRVLGILPELAAAVSAPLAKTDKIVMIGGSNGGSPGASKITKDVTQIMAE